MSVLPCVIKRAKSDVLSVAKRQKVRSAEETVLRLNKLPVTHYRVIIDEKMELYCHLWMGYH